MNVVGKNESILLLGANGMLGTAWSRYLDEAGVLYVALDVPDIDITDQTSVERHLTEHVDIVINCAAYTAVDAAESAQDINESLNHVAVQYLALRCKAIHATLIHYSTDYVFNGESASPWAIDDLYDPVNAYGAAKARGEEAISNSDCEHLIIRTSWLYASWGGNFVKTILKIGAERDSIKVINDQRGRPTWACQLVDLSWKLYHAEARGIYHVTDDGQCTWYEFAKEIIRLAGVDCMVQPCSTDEYPTSAKRPRYSVLDIEHSRDIVSEIMPWQACLKRVIEEINRT